MIKAVLLDFDGTLVYKDILDVACRIVGKEEESKKINQDYLNGKITGQTSLIKRINFLKKQQIISILYSGNITPILAYYQKLLGIDYVVGTDIKISKDKINGVTKKDFKRTKLLGINEILNKLSIAEKDCLAIGDSQADKKIFELVGKSIAINPKESIEQFADYVIKTDLRKAIPIIEKLNN